MYFLSVSQNIGFQFSKSHLKKSEQTKFFFIIFLAVRSSNSMPSLVRRSMTLSWHSWTLSNISSTPYSVLRAVSQSIPCWIRFHTIYTTNCPFPNDDSRNVFVGSSQSLSGILSHIRFTIEYGVKNSWVPLCCLFLSFMVL